MPNVATSVSITVEQWEKCSKYHINRSKVARDAIQKEIEKMEKSGETNV